MMRLILLITAVVLVAVSCNKSPVTTHKSGTDSLMGGKWRYTEQFMSSGGPGSWYGVQPDSQWIQLKPGGAVSSNLLPFSMADTYTLPDAGTIKFIIPSKPDGFLLFQYKIDGIKDELVMSPLNPLCIEGCALKFKR